MKVQHIQFSREKNAEFVAELKRRVNQYFKEKGISKQANFTMVLKTISMIALLLVPYALMMFGVVSNIWAHYLMWAIMGLGVSGIGMSVMHDANHGAYSKSRTINRVIGRFIDLVGGNATNWKIQHNLLHHTYTNIHGLDQDINAGVVLRLSPEQKRRKFHKYQHIYAWFLYGLMTLPWMTVKDFFQMVEFRNKNLNKGRSRKFWQEYTLMVAIKIFYYSYMLVLPIIILPFAWWQIILGFVLMHYVTGGTLATIFQLAHVMPETMNKLEIVDNSMEENWFVHQLETTTDFARNNWLISWYIGGLNFQVEHHLFPNICHVHYKRLSQIVEETAREYGVVYNNIPSMMRALIEHGKVLKRLGTVA
jgi:linoleoyl-CoA desaturase